MSENNKPKAQKPKPAPTKKAAKKKAAPKRAASTRTAEEQAAREQRLLEKREPENLDQHIQDALALNSMTRDDTHLIYKILKAYFDPQLLGLENIDKSRPSLFVGNHGMWGFEGGFVPSAILAHTGTMPRLLTHAELLMGPLEKPLMKLGQVLAHPKVCSAMMASGQSIMVFPGGAREGAKKRGEQYKLMWEGRTGFVRMAIEHGFTITPFGTVGPDEMWDIRWDGNEMDNMLIGKLLRRIDPEAYDPADIPPFPKGILGSIIPRPERFYISFGKPIDVSEYAGKTNDKNVLNKVRDNVETQLANLIKDTLVERTRRRDNMHWLRKRLTRY